MRTVIQHELTVSELAAKVKAKDISSLFRHKSRRDATAAFLKAEGLTVKRGASRGAQLHPEHVIDFVGTYETGFGNTDYQRTWAVLYSLQVIKTEEELTAERFDREEAEARNPRLAKADRVHPCG